VPRSPEELAQHNCILVSSHPPVWPFDAPDGPRGVKVTGNVTANNAETAVQLAILGLGVIRLGDILVGDPLRRKQLVSLLVKAHHVEPVPIHATYLPGRHRSPKVAAMVDFLLEHFSHAPWRVPGKNASVRSRPTTV
jgi:DNA-binding transcriptional LysR family regulator